MNGDGAHARASWQQWSVWLARTGYSDMEHSTIVTQQQINRAQIEEAVRTPAKIYAAALEIERAWDARAQAEVSQPVMLVRVDEAIV